MNSVQTTDLIDAKISFLQSLFEKINSQQLDPVEKFEDLYLLINVIKEDINHEEIKKDSKKLL